MKDEKEIQNLLGERATDEFMDWLRVIGYFTAPAAKSHHGNYEGGLVDHSYCVGAELNNMTEKHELNWSRPESPWVVGLLHDICKVDDYIKIQDDTSNYCTFDYNKNAIYPGHGDKSIIMLMGHFPLEEDEKMCIMYHMGAFTDKEQWKYYSNAVKICPAVLYTHTADMIAAQIVGI